MRQNLRQLLAKANKIDRLDAELLLACVLGKSREYILAHWEDPVSFLVSLKYLFLIRKRQKGIPVAYITGYKEFFGLDFKVDKHTLIPRPDTEILVENVIETINNKQLTMNNLLLVDVGTGTGCIPISVIKTLKHESPSSRAKHTTGQGIKAIGVDISNKALRVAKENARKHNVDIEFLKGSLLKPISNRKLLIDNCSLLIVANLPYLTEEQFREEKSIQHEPKLALVAKKDGLELYEKLLKQIKQLTTSYKLQAISYLEIDPAQTKKIIKLIKKIYPQAEVEIIKDLAGWDRVVKFIPN